MKKLTKIIALLLMSIFFISCFDNEEKIANKIKANLKTKYGEEFVLYGLGKRKMGNGRSWYECRIIPAKYVDTPKFLDDYYWAKGFYSNGNPGDSYGLVKLKESMNDFYGSKVEEIFGPNHLMLMEYNGSPDFYNWEDKLAELNELYVSQEEYYKELNIVPSYEPITGSIYIYGKVDTDEDKEIYREKIFKLIQYFKKTGSFEYMNLFIGLKDEVTLLTEVELLFKLISYSDLSDDEKEKKMKMIIEEFTEPFSKLSDFEIEKKIESINKGNYKKESYGSKIGINIFSPKYLKGVKSNEAINEYNNLDDIKFDWCDI